MACQQPPRTGGCNRLWPGIHRPGSFCRPLFADILAKDMNSDTKVVIENQLEKTNHDHLGKCITYSSVLNARIVVWISPQFTDEHKKAMECAALPSGILVLPALSSLATSSTN